jgi:hypothetical protein
MRKARSRQIAGVCLLVLTAVALLCTFHPMAARADSGPIYFSAGILVPTTSNDIRMTREVLTIDYTSQVANPAALVDVHARFWFRNEGRAVTQKMGFPLGREVLSGFGYWDSGFTVKADGAAVTTTPFDDQKSTAGNALTYTMWRTFEVPFATGQTRLVDVTYKIRPRDGYFLYVLQTGRLWKGPIGDLTIDVNFGRAPAFPDLLSVQPAGYRTQGNHILWHFTNEEPEQDIEIESMSPEFWKSVRPLKEAAERTGSDADWYRYAMALLPDSIIGPYSAESQGEDTPIVPQGFARGLQTSAYADYVQRTLITALNHCTHGSPWTRILTTAYGVRFSSYRVMGSFLDGVEVWRSSPSTRAHEVYEDLRTAGLTTDNASPEETRLLALLTVNMAGESMSAGYTLVAIHELEQSQVLAKEAGILDSTGYLNLFQSAAARLSPWNRARLPVGVSSVPRIEIQQQQTDVPEGSSAWRARIIVHFAFPASDVPFLPDNGVWPEPDWSTMPEIDNKTGLVKDSSSMTWGFSETDPGDYLIVLNLPDIRSAEDLQQTVMNLASTFAISLPYNRMPFLAAPYYAFNYPANTARAYPLQSASYNWLLAIAPHVSFDASRGVIVTLDAKAPISDALCATAETQMNQVIATFDKLSWAKDYQIDDTLQHNLDLIQANRGKNPSVTAITYAADGSVSRTSTSASSRSTLWIVLAGIGGLLAGAAMGILVAARRKRRLEHEPQGAPTDSR